MALKETLRKFKERVLSQVSGDDVAVMEKATQELVRSGIAERARKIGDQAPGFSLPNSNGEMVQLSDLLARGPVVITFYRGEW